MGYSRKRADQDGRPRYTAYYWNLRGRECSAGTFPRKKDADRAWQAAEARVAEGRATDLRRGRQRFGEYVTETWLPNHVMELSTRQSYTYVINKYLLPEFQSLRMNEIMPGTVRDFVRKLQSDGASPYAIDKARTILSAIFRTALNDQIIFLHPCKGVKIPPTPRKPLTIVTPEQFDAIYEALPDAMSRLMVETGIESGLRWGELAELRTADLDLATSILTVSRTVVELDPKFHPEGGRFLVKPYPKNTKYRRFKLSRQVVERIGAHLSERRVGPVDLLFTAPSEPLPRLIVVPDPATLGRTEPNAAGRRYRHGTLTGYSLGRCRCQHCKAAYAVYRTERRANGKDDPRRGRPLDTDGHIPRGWFRERVWKPALATAGIDRRVRFHDLRHAHASWLLSGGADLQVVKERLGHGSLRTTEKYLHTLPDADETALDALARVRGGRTASRSLFAKESVRPL
jgi:integrase